MDSQALEELRVQSSSVTPELDFVPVVFAVALFFAITIEREVWKLIEDHPDFHRAVRKRNARIMDLAIILSIVLWSIKWMFDL